MMLWLLFRKGTYYLHSLISAFGVGCLDSVMNTVSKSRPFSIVDLFLLLLLLLLFLFCFVFVVVSLFCFVVFVLVVDLFV